MCLSVIKWKIKTLYTCCEQVDTRGKDYDDGIRLEWSALFWGRFTPGETPSTPLVIGLLGPQTPSGHFREEKTRLNSDGIRTIITWLYSL
jgi:hypothetical protein